jgi:hypothetical protein
MDFFAKADGLGPGDVLNFVATAIIATIVSWFVARRQVRAAERASLEHQVDELLRIAIEYPYLEDDEFVAEADNLNTDKDKRLRYECYCCFVFNLMERVWRHCGGNREKVEQVIYVRELVLLHKRWWLRASDNSLGYPKKFCEFVRTYLN